MGTETTKVVRGQGQLDLDADTESADNLFSAGAVSLDLLAFDSGESMSL